MTPAAERLAALEASCDQRQALAFFDALPAVPAAALRGRWRGRELATGHPMDGLLDATGWYGKQFDGPEDVHPLLFRASSGEIFPVDPRRVPMGLAGRVPVPLVARVRGLVGAARPLVRSRGYAARLRDIAHRGIVTAAMVYDARPIIDVFRRVDDDTVLGLMDLRGDEGSYFFVLQQER